MKRQYSNFVEKARPESTGKRFTERRHGLPERDTDLYIGAKRAQNNLNASFHYVFVHSAEPRRMMVAEIAWVHAVL